MHTKQPLTDEEREQRRAKQPEPVKAWIEQLRRSDGWQAYLRMTTRALSSLNARPLDPGHLASLALHRDAFARVRPLGRLLSYTTTKESH